MTSLASPSNHFLSSLLFLWARLHVSFPHHPTHTPAMSSRGRSTSPKPLTPSPRRAAAADVSMSPARNGSRKPGGSSSGGPPKVVVVQGLSKNVYPAHLREIFGVYGRVTGLDLPVFKFCKWSLRVMVKRVGSCSQLLYILFIVPELARRDRTRRSPSIHILHSCNICSRM